MRAKEAEDATVTGDPANVRVQIVVPVHTLDRPIRRAVESILADPYSGVIVVAHNVDPEDLDLPRDSRIQVVHVEGAHGKPGAAFDAGIAAATAPWVGIMGSDDWYAPGALGVLHRHALEDGADFVLTPLAFPGGVRRLNPQTLRHRNLDAVRDRLFYRTAPLGIARRELMQDPRYHFGDELSVGEDLRSSVRLWTDGLSISYYPDDPPYVGGQDAKTRVTRTARSLRDHGAAWRAIWDDPEVKKLSDAQRNALAVKLLRVHVHGVLAQRTSAEDWTADDFQWLSDLASLIVSEAPRALQSFRESTVRTFRALMSGDLSATLEAFQQERSAGVAGVLPDSVWGWAASDGPMRNVAVSTLDRLRSQLRAGRESAGVESPRQPQPRGGNEALASKDAAASLLILSFSTIRNDARVRRQVELFRDKYRVTTCGFGPAPDGVVAHIELPPDLLPTALDGRLITLRQYRAAYWAIPAVRNAWRKLRGRRFDAVLADDIEALPLALRLRPRYGVHSDLHEHFPSLHEYHPAWRRRISPYYSWLVGRYVPRAASATTVSSGLQRAYRAQFGFNPGLVPNATPYADLSPTTVTRPIRLVHSGACQRKRHLEVMLDAVRLADADVTVDMFVTPNDPDYLAELIDTYGADERITFNEPVPYEDLVEVLNSFDVGVFARPAETFSQRWSLPNKFFDFIQARLGIIISPSPEMSHLVDRIGNGTVTDGSDAKALAEVLEALTPDQVAQWKERSDLVARSLAGERLTRPWEQAIQALMGSGA